MEVDYSGNLPKPDGYSSSNMETEISPILLVLYRMRDSMRDPMKNEAPPVKKQKLDQTKPSSLNRVHLKRKLSERFRRKQFERRREALRSWQWQADRRNRRARLIQEASWKELKREDLMRAGKNLSSRSGCSFAKYLKRFGKENVKEKTIDSPISIMTHISRESGRSRSPIHFGSP